MRWMTLLAILSLSAACGTKGRVMSEPPVWGDKEGKLNVRMDLAKAMIKNDRYDEALTIISMLRHEGYREPELDLLQGKCMARQGLFTEAEELLKVAKHRMKRSAEPDHELGVLYADSERPELAISAFQSAVSIDKRRAKDWNNLGFLLLSEKRHNEASEALRQAVSLDPTKERYRSNLAFSLFGEDKKAEAFRVFKSVLSAADAHYNMGVAHELSGDQSAAEEQYLMALNANPTHQAAQEAQKRLTKKQEQTP